MHEWIIKSDKKSATCKNCNYKIVSDDSDDTRGGGSMHMPNKKTIYLGKPEITATDAEKQVRVWRVICKNE